MDKQKKSEWGRRLRKVALSSALLATPTIWAEKFTDGFTTVPHKDTAVSDTRLLSSAENKQITRASKTRFVDVVMGYNARDQKPDHKIPLTDVELTYAHDRYQHYELLDESRGSNSILGNTGFYGAVFRDKTTGKKILYMSGMNFSTGLKDLYDDLDDIVMLSSGGKISQLHDAMDFAQKAEKKYGIDYISGHSLGGYLALYLQGMGLCPHAECYIYDTSGVTTTMAKTCAELSPNHLSQQQVEKNLKRCISLTVTHNALNDLGQQAGIALTVNNKPNAFYDLTPHDHIYDDRFIKIMDKARFIPRENNGTSGGPPIIVGLFLLAATMPFMGDIKKAMQKKSEPAR